jgi:hypothetical protein
MTFRKEKSKWITGCFSRSEGKLTVAYSPMKNKQFFLLFLFCPAILFAQDSAVTVERKVITLKEVVVRNNLDIPSFINRVKTDTTFYKAFKNLHLLGYTALNDIRMMDKNNKLKASLESKTKQTVSNGCRTMEILQEKTTGDIYDKNKNWNYYTAELYANLMFTNGKICGENNIVQGSEINTQGKSGMAKHREQLKMLFFNPGSRIPGIPFIGNKIALFDEDVAKLYDFVIDMQDYKGENCYVFIITTRSDLSRSEKNDVVINQMTTWFNSRTMEIVARDYDLSYDAGVYDFDVHMEVQLDNFGAYLVPKLIRYIGNWHAVFKKRENGIFTATLFDFTN